MKELLVILAKQMPEDHLIEKLYEAITNYRLTKSEKSKAELTLMATMTFIRFSTENASPIDLIQALNKQEKLDSLFADNKQ